MVCVGWVARVDEHAVSLREARNLSQGMVITRPGQSWDGSCMVLKRRNSFAYGGVM
jgi:hypothetical protein